VINEAAAKAFWPDRDPVGRRFRYGSPTDPPRESDWIQIVGIVGNMHQMGIDVPPRAEIYLPVNQATKPDPTYLVVRAATDPVALVPAVVREIRTVDPEMPVSGIQSLGEITDAELAQRKMQAWTIAIFAAVALVLAGIGIYGVLAFAVVQRTSEIGVRMALGAKGLDVIRMIAGRGLKLAGIGVVAGLIAAMGLTRFMASILFGVRPDDPATFAAIAAVLLTVAFAASVIPAARAARLDPVRALREE
jgi:putative ABC transport system permease protein